MDITLITWACLDCEKIFGIQEGEEDVTCPYCQSEAVGCVSEGVN